MTATAMTGLFDPQPRSLVVRDLVSRSRRRLEGLPDDPLAALLEDALYQERKRLERQTPKEGELARLEALARALVRGDRVAKIDAALALVADWGEEIHGRFDPRLYRFATRLLPRALTGLLAPDPVRRMANGGLDPESRLSVRGDLPFLQELAQEATLVLAPTHVSNLDSPLIGLALHLAGLPPFVYGAGLNLFSNPLMGFFLRRLGAYTVDRTKRAALYKDVLKDYSVRCLVTRHHSLFFPGGTRSRSGVLEQRVKKGLLGTAVVAWQEMLEAERARPEVYVVPLTLSFQLVLEARTLIDDHLEEEGRQRYIITDDEFAQPRRVADFVRRILELDDAIVACFGEPLDCLGNPVARDATERRAQAKERRRYVCDAEGRVERDPQRDHVYTDQLADALAAAWPRHATVMSTHLAAWAAWALLEQRIGSTDPFRLVRVPELSRQFQRRRYLGALEQARRHVMEGARAGRWDVQLPETAEGVLCQATDRFAAYHRTQALAARGDDVVIADAKLCLFYRNRLAHPALLDPLELEDP